MRHGPSHKLYEACKKARARFSSQNGHVSKKVWNDNYEAIKALDEAIADYNEAIQAMDEVNNSYGKVLPEFDNSYEVIDHTEKGDDWYE